MDALRAGVLVLLTGLTGGVRALETGCTRPEAPVVPDGARASRAELLTAGEAVRAFVAASESYLACLEAREAARGDDLTARQRARMDAIQDAGVEAMRTAADAYNEALRVYRARPDAS
mgnify:CR=1 FL=1